MWKQNKDDSKKYAERQAVTPAYGMISPGSDTNHWLELFKVVGFFKNLGIFI